MQDPQALAQAATNALAGDKHRITDADVPPLPGLYAIWAPSSVWITLSLEPGQQSTPLYVGKSESSLRGREVNTHFAANAAGSSRTGSSTVRRSFAALLAQSLGLRATPRNLAKPGYFANYSLTQETDLKLTQWMHEHLLISVWVAPTDSGVPLHSIERNVIAHWDPPINIDHAQTPRTELKAARAALARQAETWRGQ